MIKLLKNSFSRFINLFKLSSNLNFEDIMDSLAITNFSKTKGSYFLFWGIALFVIIFIIWASLARVDQVVRASGTVAPQSKVHAVQSPNSGILEEINVKLSDQVEKGQILFLVGNKQAQKNYDIAKETRDAREKKLRVIQELVDKGSEAEARLIDERLLFLEAEQKFQNAELQLKFSSIKSPVKGQVNDVLIANVEQVVQSGQTLASIVPYDDSLVIVVQVQPKDIAFVIPGLNAKIAFTAYDMSIYGQFEGKVTKVAPSTSINEESNIYFYETLIEVDLAKTKGQKKINLQSGMQADISIIGEERTVLSYIINPISKLSKTALRD